MPAEGWYKPYFLKLLLSMLCVCVCVQACVCVRVDVCAGGRVCAGGHVHVCVLECICCL